MDQADLVALTKTGQPWDRLSASIQACAFAYGTKGLNRIS